MLSPPHLPLTLTNSIRSPFCVASLTLTHPRRWRGGRTCGRVGGTSQLWNRHKSEITVLIKEKQYKKIPGEKLSAYFQMKSNMKDGQLLTGDARLLVLRCRRSTSKRACTCTWPSCPRTAATSTWRRNSLWTRSSTICSR